ncbi:MAG: Flp family type IVb pilin [Acidobacteria bacterium]|nr:Flp family type IVb pilin [Acidobacteriota bacterium]MBI3426330.1 Flp family type IVb pilin [Acidobacteriota bacterium]
MNMIKNFLNDESGLELSEYAVATALVVAALVTAFTQLGSGIKGRLTALTGVITSIS